MTASSPCGIFSQAELADEPGDNPLYHPARAGQPAPHERHSAGGSARSVRSGSKPYSARQFTN